MTPYYADAHLTVYQGNARAVLADLPAESVHCVVTSPPYWGLRDYGVPGQLGLEPTPEEYVAALVDVFREVRRVLRDDGTVWLNMGDSYTSGGRKTRDPGQSKIHPALENWTAGRADNPAGLKDKDLVGIPWRVAFALQADGWWLRKRIVWCKPNPMPESVTDRPTSATEDLFLLSKSARYFYDADAVRERAESGPSDLRKMAEGRERIGGLVKEQTDPLLRASALTNIGRKRSVGGRPLGPKGEATPDGMLRSAGARMGRGAGWRDDPETAVAGRNLRDWWVIATEPYPGAHFATFPRKLVEPCVKAGTSERGVCPECGAPWARVVERTPNPSKGTNTGIDMSGGAAKTSNPQTSNGMHRNGTNVAAPAPTTTGWRPTCAHYTPDGEADFPVEWQAKTRTWRTEKRPTFSGAYATVLAVVLDPFAGTGTVGLVAQYLGRRAMLIDLSADYLVQCLERNRQVPLGLGA